tara:strand:- start:165 stop:293 length:129 start_codon:yes stop_codon:yes gene_type:complete
MTKIINDIEKVHPMKQIFIASLVQLGMLVFMFGSMLIIGLVL